MPASGYEEDDEDDLDPRTGKSKGDKPSSRAPAAAGDNLFGPLALVEAETEKLPQAHIGDLLTTSTPGRNVPTSLLAQNLAQEQCNNLQQLQPRSA